MRYSHLATGLLAAALALALFLPLGRPGAVRAQADQRFFQDTGFRVDHDLIWEFYIQHGATRSFGSPVSRTFRLFGLPTQIFERHVVQVDEGGQVAAVNLLDTYWMPYTQLRGLPVPPYDPAVVGAAPGETAGDFAGEMVSFLQNHLPEEAFGYPVRFFTVFNETVEPVDPSIVDPLQVQARTLRNLGVWGIPTSQPLRDPARPNTVLLRLERGILRYDDACRCTQPLPMGNLFKALITGNDLPSDLVEQGPSSPFLRQYDFSTESGPHRPDELPNTDLTYAFLHSLEGPPANLDLVGPVVVPTEPAVAPTSTPLVQPTATAGPPAQPTATPKPLPTPGPISLHPSAIVLRPEETGRETTLVETKDGEDEQATWQSVRYIRERDLETSGLGPNVLYNKIYVARNQTIAREIYGLEIADRGFPEAVDRHEGWFFGEKPDGLGAEVHLLGSCEEGCNTSRYNLHLRYVYRRGNVVSVFYTFGDQLSSSEEQVYYLAKHVADRMAW